MSAVLAAEAIGSALGCRLSLRSSRNWQSASFSGMRLLLTTEADVPQDLEEVEVAIPGWVLADIAKEGPHTIEALLVEIEP